MQETDTLKEIATQLAWCAVGGDIDWSAIAFRWRDDGRLQGVASPGITDHHARYEPLNPTGSWSALGTHTGVR